MTSYNAGDAKLQIIPDASGFKRRLEADLRKIQVDYAVKVSADTSRAARDLEAFRTRENANAVNLKVDVDTAGAAAKIASLRNALGGGGGGGGRGGLGGFLTGPIGIPLIFTGIGELPAATVAITNVAGALQQLSGAGAAIPGIIGGIASEVGTVKLAMSGVEDAFKAVDKASDGSAKNIAAANEALAKLAPQAADFVREVTGLKPAFDDLTKGVQGKFFDGLGKSVRDLANADLPLLNKGLGGIADALNGSLKQLGVSLSSSSSQGLLDRIFGNTKEAQTRLTAAIDPLVKGIGTLTAAGTDVLPRLADDIGKVSQRFSNFITEADKNGTLNKFINDGITGFEHLGSAGVNIVKVLNDITGAAGGDGGLLKFLDEGSQKLHEFLSSTEGQNQLKTWFEEGRREIKEHIIPLLQSLPGFFEGIYNAGRTIADTVVPPLREISHFLSEHPNLIKAAAEAFVAFKVGSGVFGLVGALGKITGLLDSIPGKAGTAGGALQSKLALGAAGGALVIGGALTQPTDGKSEPNGLAALSTLGGGALLGSQFGPIGTVLGTLGGAAIALTEVFINQANKLKDIQKANKDFYDHRPPSVPAINPNAPILPGPAIQQPNISTPNPTPGPPSLKGLLLGPEAGVGNGNGGEIRNPQGINQALGAIGDKAAAAKANVDLLANGITTLPTGEVVLKDNSPEAIQRVKDLGYTVSDLANHPGLVQIKVVYTLNGQPIDPSQLKAFTPQQAIPGEIIKPGQHAFGGGISGPGSATSDSIPAMLSNGEHVLTASDVAAMGGQAGVYRFRSALHRAGGGEAVVDQFGNPINAGQAPGPPSQQTVAPNPYNGGGIDGIVSAFTSGIQGPIGLGISAGSSLAQSGIGQASGDGGGTGAAPTFADRAAGIPGLWGLVGSAASSNPAENLMAWGQQTASWLGNFTAKTAGSFGKSLWQGALGLVGLDNSILSPNNPWFQAGEQGLAGVLDSQGIGSLLGPGQGGGRGSTDADLAALQQSGVAHLGSDRGGQAASSPAAQRAIDFAQTNAVGQKYQYGGIGPNYDCSGIASAIYAAAAGLPQGTRYFTTESDFEALGFRKGFQSGALNIGVNRGGGGRNSHMALTLPNGVNVESGGSLGATVYGGAANGASNLPLHWYLPVGGAGKGAVPGLYGMGGASRGPGGPKSDDIPAMLSNGEHVLTASDVAAMGGQGAVYAFRRGLHRAGGGGIMPSGVIVRNPRDDRWGWAKPGKQGGGKPVWSEKPGPGITGGPSWGIGGSEGRDDIHFPSEPWIPLDPYRRHREGVHALGDMAGFAEGGQVIPPSQQAARAATAQPITPTRPGGGGFQQVPNANTKQLPAAIPAPAQPTPPPPPGQPPAPAGTRPPGASSVPQVAPPAIGDALNHNHPALKKAIASTASTLGNIASQAIAAGMGGAGIPGGGAAGQFAAGLIQQGGKIVDSAANVVSSFLVGNVTSGTQDSAYGQTLRTPQNVPHTAQTRSGNTNVFNGISDIDRLVQIMDQRDALSHQAALAGRRTR